MKIQKVSKGSNHPRPTTVPLGELNGQVWAQGGAVWISPSSGVLCWDLARIRPCCFPGCGSIRARIQTPMLHIGRRETVIADRQICDKMAILNWPSYCHLLSSSTLILLHFQDVVLRESKCLLTPYFSSPHTRQTIHHSLLSICIKQSQMPICSLAHFLKRTCLKRGRASAVSIRCEKRKSIESSFSCATVIKARQVDDSSVIVYSCSCHSKQELISFFCREHIMSYS